MTMTVINKKVCLPDQVFPVGFVFPIQYRLLYLNLHPNPRNASVLPVRKSVSNSIIHQIFLKQVQIATTSQEKTVPGGEPDQDGRTTLSPAD